jgi:hypothetical protein
MTFQDLQVNNCQPRPLYPAKWSFKISREIKSFQDKHKLNQYLNTKLAFQKILKGLLYTEEEERWSQNTRDE